MDDQILPGGEAGDPAAAKAPSAPASDVRLDRLEQAMLNLASTVESAAQRLTAAPAQAPPQAPEEFLARLTENPQQVIQQVAAQTFRQAAQETLNPAVMRVLETASHQILASEQMRVDSEFGPGTFDEVIRPHLDQELTQLRGINPQAVADPATIRALVDRRFGGENFDKLATRRMGFQRAVEKGVYGFPGGGVPRLRGARLGEDELPPDVEQFLRDTDKVTGEETDRKLFGKLFNTGRDVGPGRHRTTVLEYAKAVGADADTIKSLGG